MVPYRSRNSSAINSAGPRKKENLAIWIQRRGNKVTRTYRTPIKRWIVFLGKASLFPKEETHMKKGSLSNFGVLKCLCTPGEDMH